MAFEIEEGVVKVTAQVERSSLARAAREAGDEAGVEVEKGVRSGFGKSSASNKAETTGFLRKMFTPSADAFAALRAPFAAALSTPVGAAAIVVAGVFAAAFAAAAITAVAAIGIGGIFLGLGIMALKEVKPVVKAFEDLKKTISDVGKEAAKPLIKPLIEGMNGLSDLARELKGEFRDIFSALAPVIPLLVDAFGLFSGEVLRGVRDSMPGIVAAFEGFARALPVVGKWLGDFFRTIFENSDVIDNTTEAVTLLVFGPLKLLGPLISGLTVLFGAFNQLLWMSSEGWGFLTDALLSFFDGGTGALGRFKEAWGPVSDAIQNVWDKLVAFAGEDNKELLTTRFEELIQSIKDAWEPIKKLIGVAWDEAWAFVKRIWNEKVVPWLNDTVAPWLKEKLGQIMEAAWKFAKEKAEEKIQELKDAAIAKVKSIPGAIGGALSDLGAKVRDKFNEGVTQAKNKAGELVTGAVNKIRELPGKIGTEMGKIKGRVTGAFSGAASWLYNAGHSIMTGLLNGIKQAWENVANYLSGLGNKIKNLKGPLEKDKRLLIPEGAAIMDSLMTGLASRFGGLETMLGGLTNAIPNVVSGSTGGGGLAAAGAFSPPASPSSSSGSSGSIALSPNISVYIGNEDITKIVRVEINEHDRSLDRQVSAGPGGFRL
jgi:phage-related protein